MLLGWVPRVCPGLRLDAFSDARALMSGWGLRAGVDDGLVHALPVRLSAIPALLHGPLRPDLLVATVVRRPEGGFGFGTEVSWQWAAIEAGSQVAAVVTKGLPDCDAGPALPEEQMVVVSEVDITPQTLLPPEPSDIHRTLATHASRFLSDGIRLQVGPGPLGTAVMEAIRSPVRIDSGLLPAGVVDLHRRGLLVDDPIATYLAGDAELLEWADKRQILHRLEYTHNPGRLSDGLPLVAVNTALEIDHDGQVNVERTSGSALGGIGGHPDYAAAAARSIGGLSVIAVPSQHGGRSTLVERLSAPASTSSHDVDVIITEHGAADLRGLDRTERRAAITRLWP